MGNSSAKESSPAAAPTKRRERPGSPGVPVVVPRRGGNQIQQLAYVNKPEDAVILQWSSPVFDGGTPINGYGVERKAGESGQWVRAHPLDVRETEVALTNLHPGQVYRFRVKAVNAVGWSDVGPESSPFRVPYDVSLASAPSFITGLRDAIVMEHEKVEFVVEVHGVPPPTVEWLVNDATAAKMVVNELDPDSGVSSLIVNDVMANDDGEIRCRAVNDVGQSTSSAMLSVEAPPRAMLAKKYEDGLIFEDGDAIRLKVDFTGRPRPEVTWFHEGEQIAEDDERFQVDTTADCAMLKVAGARRSDRGEYSVKLQSGLGQDSASFLVTVANRPSIPGKPHAIEIGEASLVLAWSVPEDDGGCEVTSYIVEYNRLGWDMWLKAAASRHPEVRLGDLIPGSTYIFRIKAENPYGVSEPSCQSDPIHLPAKSNETSWIGPEGSSEPADPDDTTVSSSNLGPRDYDPVVTRSSDIPLDVLQRDEQDAINEVDLFDDDDVIGDDDGGNYTPYRTTNATLWLL